MKQWSIAALALTLLLTPRVAAQLPQQGGTPTCEEILDKAVMAQGGEALRNLRSLYVEGSTFLGDGGETYVPRMGDFDTTMKAPDRFLDRDSTGHPSAGFDGRQNWTTEWTTRRPALPRIQLILPAFNWRMRYAAAKCLGRTRFRGHDTYLVRATLRANPIPAEYYYDASTFLLFAVHTLGLAPDIPDYEMTVYLSDYRTVDGVKIPWQWSADIPHVNLITYRVSRVKMNIKVPDKEFEKPR